MRSLRFPLNKILIFYRLLILSFSSLFFLGYFPQCIIDQFQKVLPAEFLKTHRWTGGGFLGSLAGLIAYHYAPWRWVHSYWVMGLALIVTVFVTHFAEKETGIHDDPRIILDEFLGVWVACWGLPQGGLLLLGAAFVLFRFFDAVKGPWARPFQRLPGGLGITLDDVSAGVIANALTRLISAFF